MARFAVVKKWHGMPDPTIIDYAATWEEAEKISKGIPEGEGYRVEIWKYASLEEE